MANYLIIGGSSGIGQSLAHTLQQCGHSVTATFYKKENIEEKAGIHYFYLDVYEPFQADLVTLESIDGLVYCPGSIDLKPFARIAPEQFMDDYNLQVIGAIRVIQGVLPKLLKGNNPSIVLFSTVAVKSGFPFHTKVSASKGAIEGLTKALAAEFAPKIRVNAISPSLTDTPLASKILSSADKKETNAMRHPMKKIGTAKDLANLAEFLLSDKASWITGQIISVDGGMSSLKLS